MAFQKKSQAKSTDESKLNIDPKRTYEFELTSDEFSPYKTIARKIKVWDEKQGKIRTARYSSVAKSPFLDDQDKEVPSENDIAFNKGKLFVPGSNSALIEFLLAHDGIEGKEMINPENERIRGEFRLVDHDLKVVGRLANKQQIAKATAIVSSADKDQLKTFMLSQFGFDADSLKDVTKKDEALELEAYDAAAASPDVFIKDFNNKKHEYKATAIYAFQAGILSDETDGQVDWAETGGLIYAYDQSKFMRATDALAAWIVETDEGKKFYGELTTKLEAE